MIFFDVVVVVKYQFCLISYVRFECGMTFAKKNYTYIGSHIKLQLSNH